MNRGLLSKSIRRRHLYPDADVQTIADAKGDVLAATAADTLERVAVGTDGQVFRSDSTATPGIAWSWHFDNWGVMRTLPNPQGATALPGFGTANRCFFYRWVGEAPATISKVGIEVGTQSGNMSIAIYRNTGSGATSAPGTRLATTGAIAVPASGYQEVSLGASYAVYPGDWIAISCDNTTATFRGAGTSAIANNLFAGMGGYQDTAHPAPSSPSITYGNFRGLLLVGVA